MAIWVQVSAVRALELAVLKGTKEDYDVCYDTPITDDVIGYLDDETLQETIELVKALPKAKEEEWYS